MICCYVLYSKMLNRYYTGVTQENLQSRLVQHNTQGYGKHRYSSRSSDWQIYLIIDCVNYSQALKIEKHIKRMHSKIYIENLHAYPEMIEKLKREYSF